MRTVGLTALLAIALPFATLTVTAAASSSPKYITPFQDVLLPVPGASEGYQVSSGRNVVYTCIGKTSAGYLILHFDSEGQTRVGTLPWRDRMGTPTVMEESLGQVTIRSGTVAQLTAGQVPLRAGRPYRVLAEMPTTYRVRFCVGSFVQDVQVSKSVVRPHTLDLAPETLLQHKGQWVRLYTRTGTRNCRIVDSDDDFLLVGGDDTNLIKLDRVPLTEITGVVGLVWYMGKRYTPDEAKVQQEREAASEREWRHRQAERDRLAAQAKKDEEARAAAAQVAEALRQETLRADFQKYRTLAELGDAQAQYNIGIQYVEGLGVERDVLKGSLWLSTAAEQGHVKALEAVAHLQWMGQGFVKDWTESCSYSMVADLLGSKEAKYNVAMCMDVFSPEQFSEAKRRAHAKLDRIKRRMVENARGK